jgi:RNA polymerase sigma factor (sigma-70 family)
MSTVEFNTQVIGYSKQLKYFALNLTSNDDDAQDLLQETLIKAIRYKDKFTEATNLKAWLYTIMKNIFINNYRKEVKIRNVVQSGMDMQTVRASAAAAPRIADSNMAELEIRNAIKSLAKEYQIAFQMYVDGYKYKEIAEHMGLPIGTVKSRIFLARQELMLKLKDFRK